MAFGLALDHFAPFFLRIGNGNGLSVVLLEETIQDLTASPTKSDAAHNNSIARSDASIFTRVLWPG